MNVTAATLGLPLGTWAVSWGIICHWTGRLVEINDLTVEVVASVASEGVTERDGESFEIQFRDGRWLRASGSVMDLDRLVQSSAHAPGWNPLADIVGRMNALPSTIDPHADLRERGRIAREGLRNLGSGS